MVDAYFHPMRMTYPIQPGPFFWAAPKWGKPAKHAASSEYFEQDRHTYCLLPSYTAASQHHEESHLIYGPLDSILLDQGFPVEYELDTFNPPHTGTPLCCLQPLLCRQQRIIPLRHPATSSLGNIYWRHSRFSPTTTRNTHSWVTT